MNYADLFVILLVLFFLLLGLFKGFVYSVFKLASFFVSAGLSLKLYPFVSNMLLKTSLFNTIKSGIANKLLIGQSAKVPEMDALVGQKSTEAILNGVALPDALNRFLVDKIPNTGQLVDFKSIVNSMSSSLAEVIVNIISVVMLFILISTILLIVRIILQAVVKLPVIKQFDKVGGMIFGTIEGVLMVFVVFSLPVFFHSWNSFEGLFKAIDSSLIAKYFYHNNILINLLFS